MRRSSTPSGLWRGSNGISKLPVVPLRQGYAKAGVTYLSVVAAAGTARTAGVNARGVLT